MIVDTSAIVAILKGEPEARRLTELIAHDAATKLSAATSVELFAVADVRGQPAQAHRVDELLSTLGITIVPFDEAQARIAREAYRDFGKGSGHAAQLNLGDCFAYALSVQSGEPLLFVGNDFAATDVTIAA